ncbi:MAG: Uma2 family endonuclease [Cyanobacteria bacterium RU_5_0]|nr:Uma2 family endonuclease [Cyanobacteria bacterium RU_5_0]
MIQAQSKLPKLLSFEEFLTWYPENGSRYELLDGEIVEVRPVGSHEEVTSYLIRKIDREIERLKLPWFIPNTCCVKPIDSDENGYISDGIILDRSSLSADPLWKRASTITRGTSARLVIEVVSTNWQDDYAKKLDDYEALGIPEYWIVDYRGLGGRRFIGSPKQPTITVYQWIEGVYQLVQFRKGDRLQSPTFPELNLAVAEIIAFGG